MYFIHTKNNKIGNYKKILSKKKRARPKRLLWPVCVQTLLTVNHTSRSTHFLVSRKFNRKRVYNCKATQESEHEKKRQFALFSFVNLRLPLQRPVERRIGVKCNEKSSNSLQKILQASQIQSESVTLSINFVMISESWSVSERKPSAMCKVFVMILVILTLLCNYLMINLYKCLWVSCVLFDSLS